MKAKIYKPAVCVLMAFLAIGGNVGFAQSISASSTDASGNGSSVSIDKDKVNPGKIGKHGSRP